MPSCPVYLCVCVCFLAGHVSRLADAEAQRMVAPAKATGGKRAGSMNWITYDADQRIIFELASLGNAHNLWGVVKNPKNKKCGLINMRAVKKLIHDQMVVTFSHEPKVVNCSADSFFTYLERAVIKSNAQETKDRSRTGKGHQDDSTLSSNLAELYARRATFIDLKSSKKTDQAAFKLAHQAQNSLLMEAGEWALQKSGSLNGRQLTRMKSAAAPTHTSASLVLSGTQHRRHTRKPHTHMHLHYMRFVRMCDYMMFVRMSDYMICVVVRELVCVCVNT